MSTKIFTEKEIEILSRNQYIKTVSMKAITYTDEFKRIFIAAHENGKFPKAIFEEHGFDIFSEWNVLIQQVEDGGLHIEKMAYVDWMILEKGIREDQVIKNSQ